MNNAPQPKEKGIMLNFRNIALIVGVLITIVFLYLVDPEVGLLKNLSAGSMVVYYLVLLSRATLVVALVHIFRKILFPYPEADFRVMLANALASPEGAGLASIAIAIMVLAISATVIAVLIA